MTDWVFWLLVVGMPILAGTAGALLMYLYLRERIDRWRAEDYEQGWEEGNAMGRLHTGSMLPEKTLLTSTVAAESLTDEARRERLAVLMDEAVEVVRADFDAIRAWVECQDLEASPPVPEWERPELAHTGPDPRD